eukprot:scaffold156735_cov42-Prasinocladus_malaysianus.AAC.1
MRLLPEGDRARILRHVNFWLADPESHPFLYGTRSLTDGQFWAQTVRPANLPPHTIAGEDEGAYGFLDLNFMLGKLEVSWLGCSELWPFMHSLSDHNIAKQKLP